jgi:hypothetical protein
MYRSIQFKGQGNATAFLVDGFEELERFPGTYIIPAIWISANTSTRGALVIGDVRFTFKEKEFRGLSYHDVLNEAGKERGEGQGRWNANRDVAPNAKALIGASSLWGDNSRGVPERMTSLLEAYQALPGLTSGYDGWYKLY